MTKVLKITMSLFVAFGLLGSANLFAAPRKPKKNLCLIAARKASAAHVRKQSYFIDFDPHHPHEAVIRSVTATTDNPDLSYDV